MLQWSNMTSNTTLLAPYRLIISVAFAGLVLLFPTLSHALSFMEGTVFLEAKTKAECEALGGHYTDWYGEIYCTQEGDVSTVTEAPEPSIEELMSEQIARAEALNLTGYTEASAARMAAEADVPFRPVVRDGEMMMVTEDYRPGRINATINNDIVMSYTIEGTNITVTAQTDVSVTPTPHTPTNDEPAPTEPATPSETPTTDTEEPSVVEPTEPSRPWWRAIIDLFVFWR